MPHYKDGEKVELLDVVVCNDNFTLPEPVPGIVVGVHPGAESCNVMLLTATEVKENPFNGTCTVGTDADGKRHLIRTQTMTVSAEGCTLVHRKTKD